MYDIIQLQLIFCFVLNRNGDGESIINGRNVRMIAEEHYTSANTLFNQLEHWDEVIRLQLEKAGIYEFQFKRMILFYLPKKKRDLVSNSIQV